ncbi:hypothetical protein RRG08_065183 [Elysia crispata]|uniref:non-specific serine/threonine protein kinase n=1 Tax=Elysia crispata TaxID=231223 RepID=A0AAE1D7R2_9GAST|nr:hypothetical protein RRG08_065183 [Elysia crispata]
MAECAQTEKKNVVYDLKDQDFFESSDLKKVKVLGKGTFGKVYLVQPKSGPGRLLAIKKISFTEDDRERRTQAFYEEVKFMQGLSHPHLVPCLLAVQCLDYFAIVMPYYPAGDLVELIGKQESSRVVRYMSHVAHAIEYLHRHDVAHIDVKLENVFVCESDCAHLGDLGMAMEVTHSSRTILAAHMGGTMEYWPPEKVNADEHTRIDPFKCDVYAIGVMYWILVSGQQPEKNVDYLAKVYASTDLDLFYTNWFTLEHLLHPKPAERPTASQVITLLESDQEYTSVAEASEAGK